MTIEYNVSEEDYINFNLFHQRNSKYGRRLSFLMRFVPAVAILAVAFISFSDVFFLAFGMFVAFMWVIMYPRYEKDGYTKAVRKFIREGKANDFIGSQKLSLKSDFIEEVTRSSTSQTRYEAVERVGRGYGCFFVYIGAIKAIIVPVAAFSDEGQAGKFLDILKEKTGHEPVGEL
ncbi:MAG: YcxB family protein [Defluviitaleaceae bacterium]|nr:YcxB family protein [Defluviitaleaceae bacterium]